MADPPASVPPAAAGPAPEPGPAPSHPEPFSTATPDHADRYEAVDASIVPVPVESLNRLVIAVDELGNEMTQVRQAIRELTTALSESQASFARIVAGNGTTGNGTPDPLAAVTGPYVAGAPSPTPFADAAPTPADAPTPMAPTPPADPAANLGVAAGPVAPPTAEQLEPPVNPARGLGDLPIVSTGEVPVVIGPIRALDELDDAIEHIRRITGVEDVSVTAFEGSDVVLTTVLGRPLPLASLLRTELGRDVTSCRVAGGRIVVAFSEAGRPA